MEKNSNRQASRMYKYLSADAFASKILYLLIGGTVKDTALILKFALEFWFVVKTSIFLIFRYKRHGHAVYLHWFPLTTCIYISINLIAIYLAKLQYSLCIGFFYVTIFLFLQSTVLHMNIRENQGSMFRFGSFDTLISFKVTGMRL